eukprot:4587115-Amphidinium_carterae.1
MTDDIKNIVAGHCDWLYYLRPSQWRPSSARTGLGPSVHVGWSRQASCIPASMPMLRYVIHP